MDLQPAVPRLAQHAVLLRRGPDELQVGVEPSVVVPTRYAPLVRGLAGGAADGDLVRLASRDGLEPDAVPRLMAALGQAGLLRRPPVAAALAVRVVGAGPLGGRTAQELVRAGFGSLYLAELPGREPPDVTPRASAADRRRRPATPHRVDLLASVLADLGSSVRVRRSRHFVKPEGGAVALTVVVADGPEPDRLVTDLLREHGAPHLLVRCSGDEATVGPLVVPGSTSCVRCADLTRRDADPRWPWLLEQLVRLPAEPEATVLAWAAVTATVQALAFVAGVAPETVGHTLELTAAEYAPSLRAWAPHPECPCRWETASAVGTATA